MNAWRERGLYFGPLKDFRGGVIVEEGETTDGGFRAIPGTRIEIRVNKHPPGGKAQSSLRLYKDDGSLVGEQEVELPPGASYFGHSDAWNALAFTHERSQPAR